MTLTADELDILISGLFHTCRAILKDMAVEENSLAQTYVKSATEENLASVAVLIYEAKEKLTDYLKEKIGDK